MIYTVVYDDEKQTYQVFEGHEEPKEITDKFELHNLVVDMGDRHVKGFLVGIPEAKRSKEGAEL